MDLHMPEMGGLEATSNIRKKRSPASLIPIIALTAHAIKGVEEECLKAGMNAFVTKPINYEKLFSTLSKFLNQEKVQKV